MDKPLQRAKAANRLTGLAGREGRATAIAKDTKMPRDTATPEENDPLWEQLGSTRVTGDSTEKVLAAGNKQMSANFTQMGPGQVLGDNVTSLGEFKLIKKLGEGAMGAVYKAEWVTRDKIVALKILFPHVANNEKLVKRLQREAQVMFDLDHPNIVEAFAYDVIDGFHCVAMEYISGQSMQKWLAQINRLPVADAVRVTLDCAKALAYAHSLNMVHRDVKPDNILLTKKGHVKLADMGMVKIDDEEMSLTQTGHAVGTPWFMPLEQARNAKEIDGRSDIYALGCTLYAFLTGQPPFTGRTLVDVIRAKEIGTFQPARSANSDVPERLDLILAKMTAKLPKYRYQTCDELIKDLESLEMASERLGFVNQKPVVKENADDGFEAMGKTSVSAPTKSRADVDFAASAAPTLDLNIWYVQQKLPDGTTTTRQYTTAQIHKMLAEGTIKPNARASHLQDEGFRTLGTYKEFQGAALNTLTKKAADKNTARYRGLYKKIEEEDQKKEQEEQERDSDADETTIQATRKYWMAVFLKMLPVGIGIVVGVIVLLWILKALFAT